jgi:transcriptional regulator with XRE-family HTH domain
MQSGEELRAARLAAGLSLDAMATRTRFSKPHLGNVEQGRRTPTPAIVAAYERVLVQWAPDPDLYERGTHAAATGKVDVPLIRRTAGSLYNLRRDEDKNGGAKQWHTVRDQLNVVTFEVPQVAEPDSLLMLAAEHAHWLSWVCYHNGQHPAARAWLDMATGWAQDAGSVEMLAFIARVRSFYLLRTDQPQRALKAAETASYARLTPATRSIVAHAESLAAASLGDRDRALSLADQAYADALEAPDEDARPPWLYWLDPARAVLNRADVAYRVGDFSTAAKLFAEGIEQLADFPRDQAVYLTRLREAQARS